MELPLQDVPNFIASQDPYEALHQFAGARGLGFMKVETSADGLLPFPPSTPNRDVPCECVKYVVPPHCAMCVFASAIRTQMRCCALTSMRGDAHVAVTGILAGPSPRGAHKHAVVGKAAGRQLSPVCDP